jgi:hypothetical protein
METRATHKGTTRRGEKKVMNSMSTEDNNGYDTTTNEDHFLTESLRTIHGELMPLMVSARKHGDRQTALMAANMIRNRVKVLVEGGFVNPPDGSQMLKDMERIRQGLSRDRSLLERALTYSTRLAAAQARQASARAAHKNDRTVNKA